MLVGGFEDEDPSSVLATNLYYGSDRLLGHVLLQQIFKISSSLLALLTVTL